jgi:hypothetical protein
MSDTSIRTAPDPRLVGEPMGLPQSKPKTRTQPWPLQILKPLASLRLTVVLFVLSIFLVFVGTLAQMDEGIWTVVNKYFRSVYVFVPFQVFVGFGHVFFGVPETFRVWGGFPYPGGFTLSILLLVNLLAAHLVRFKLSWKRSGIFLIHAGLILMLVGEWLSYPRFTSEGRLRIPEGQSSNYLFHTTACEIAISTPTADGKQDDVIVVPESMLERGGTIHDPRLPFDIEINKFMLNSKLLDGRNKDADFPADHGLGLQYDVEERREGVGVDANAPENCPSAYVTLRDKENHDVLGHYLLSTWFTDLLRLDNQQVTVGDKTYSVDLRYKRTYKPYKMHLIKVTTTMYPGTDIPKDYNSVVRLEDPSTGEDRTVKIQMNKPLRYGGETFYQSGVDGDTTILQVVHNPGSSLPFGWTLPILSCVIVGIGMVVHFVLSLVAFLNNRRVLSHA